jgi:two-component system LytT family response regulator
MKIRTLIVDDESLARDRLRQLLVNEPEIEIVGECADGREAVAAIQKTPPDLIFLDVQMPELDGFGVLEAMGAGPMPVIVFVTAYDQFAVRAFEVHAVDYLLKPFDR